eukprot:TRINITY_DN2869_c0_g1_i2.p1 TRINITY_DN2869_c0_g1~~TRINITY_DN2869_c0_g1_i2.p1  ORF type:complete len:245 (-),score=86.81 TRINITY_DN2869_c0_g1_i2:218-952(-)
MISINSLLNPENQDIEYSEQVEYEQMQNDQQYYQQMPVYSSNYNQSVYSSNEECNKRNYEELDYEANELLNFQQNIVNESNKKRKMTPIVRQTSNNNTSSHNLKPSQTFRLPSKPPQIDLEKFKYRMKKEELERLTIKNTLMTDITSLLTLTQKAAAAKLDMSESMLCKKFKESVNKKWPYRQIRKVEREIAITENNEELEKLIQLRNEYIRPVSIYVRRFLTQEEVDDDNFKFDNTQVDPEIF